MPLSMYIEPQYIIAIKKLYCCRQIYILKSSILYRYVLGIETVTTPHNHNLIVVK